MTPGTEPAAPGFVYQLDSIVSRATAVQWGLGLNDALLWGHRVKLHLLIEDYLIARQRAHACRAQWLKNKKRAQKEPLRVHYHDMETLRTERRLRHALGQTDIADRRIRLPEHPLNLARPTIRSIRQTDRQYGCRCAACGRPTP